MQIFPKAHKLSAIFLALLLVVTPVTTSVTYAEEGESGGEQQTEQQDPPAEEQQPDPPADDPPVEEQQETQTEEQAESQEEQQEPPAEEQQEQQPETQGESEGTEDQGESQENQEEQSGETQSEESGESSESQEEEQEAEQQQQTETQDESQYNQQQESQNEGQGWSPTYDDSTVVAETGDVVGVTQVNNNVNSNQVESNNFEGHGSTVCDNCLGSPHATNEGTGDESQNVAETQENTSDNVTNDNEGQINNTVGNSGSSGYNLLADNLADTGLSTGDIQLISQILNILNFNVVGSNYVAEAYSLVGKVIDDLDLSRYEIDDLAEQVAQNEAFNDFRAANFDTGDGSANYASGAQDDSTSVTNTNDGDIHNTVELDAVSGINTVVNNGSVVIQTGDISMLSQLVNISNTNIVGKDWNFVIVNITGEWDGSLLLPSITQAIQHTAEAPGTCAGECQYDGAAVNELTGDGSVNVAESNHDESTVYVNDNDATVDNDVTVVGDSGSNVVADNGGNVYMETGDVITINDVLNYVNRNVIQSNWVWGVINMAGGSWQGNIWGMPEEGFVMNDAGSHIVFNYTPNSMTLYGNNGAAHEALAVNQGTGDDSMNEAYVYSDGSYTVANANTANITNEVSLNGVSGQNVVAGNEGDVLVQTGDITAISQIFNMANTNVIGNNWTMAIINVLGNWGGNLYFGQPDLSLLEIVAPDPDPAVPDGMLYYTLTVTNQGDAPATGVNLTARIDPAKVEIIDAGGGSHEWNQINWEIPRIEVGEIVTKYYQARVRDHVHDAAMIYNNATVYGNEAERHETNNFAETAVQVYNPGTQAPSEGQGNTQETNQNTESGDSTIEQQGYVTAEGSHESGGEQQQEDAGQPTGPIVSNNIGQSMDISNPANDGRPPQGFGQPNPQPQQQSQDRFANPQKSDVLQIEILNDADGPVKAGEVVNYTLKITNTINESLYDVYVFDQMIGPNGDIINTQEWPLGEVYPNEVIGIKYSVQLASDAPSGAYKTESWSDGFNKNDTYHIFPLADGVVQVAGAVDPQEQTEDGQGEEQTETDEQVDETAGEDVEAGAQTAVVPEVDIKYEYYQEKPQLTEFDEEVVVTNTGSSSINPGILAVRYDDSLLSLQGGEDGMLVVPTEALEPGESVTIALHGQSSNTEGRAEVGIAYIVDEVILSTISSFHTIAPAEKAVPDSQEALSTSENVVITAETAVTEQESFDDALQPRVLGATEVLDIVPHSDLYDQQNSVQAGILDGLQSWVVWGVVVVLFFGVTAVQRRQRRGELEQV